jgi:hypothetical protein
LGNFGALLHAMPPAWPGAASLRPCYEGESQAGKKAIGFRLG